VKNERQTDDIAVEAIVETIRTDIISGHLAPGSDINSVELATRFGTSRTPVREALLILDRYGLVTLAARKRPRVAPVSVQAIRDLFALRMALHIYISDAIIASASDGELERMRSRAEALADRNGSLPVLEQLAKIEEYLDFEYRLCGNELVIEMLGSLKWRIGWFRRLAMMTPEQLHKIAIDRLRVADAYIERDAALAAALNNSMLRRGAEYSEKNFLVLHKPPIQ
jgi:DNA-binding GntR family transcriptional regulator